MGRYRDTFAKKEKKAKGPHPIWRGIGCLLMIFVPVLSFVAAEVSMNDFFLPRGILIRHLSFTIEVPEVVARYIPDLAKSINRTSENPITFPTIWLLRALSLLVISGFFSVIYALMYRMVAPPKFGPTDAPPSRVKIKKYKR